VRRLDLADLVALAAETAGIGTPKLVELLETARFAALLAEAGPPSPPHEAAATLLVGIVAAEPLPSGSGRLALVAALRLLAVNGLDVALDPRATGALLAAVGDGRKDAAAVAAELDGAVTARDPLDGELRERLSPDAWQALGLAHARARRHGRRLAGPADLLIGLFGENEVVTRPAGPLVPVGVPAFEPATRKALELALRAAVRLGHADITGGHLLLGLLDGGHAGLLPDGVEALDLRRQVVARLGPATAAGGEVAERLDRLAAWLRVTDPEAAAELDDVADLHRAGLDRLVEMVRAWRGEIFLDAVAKDELVARMLGPRRLAPPPR
jgi:hypothetical protein